jgi:hypothetical protein
MFQQGCCTNTPTTPWVPPGNFEFKATPMSHCRCQPSYLCIKICSLLFLLGEKSSLNSADFCNYFDSGPFHPQDFHWNSIFPIINFVPANLKHIHASSEYFPAINSSNFMHQKMLLPFFILPKKIISTCFPCKTSRCYFGGKKYCKYYL